MRACASMRSLCALYKYANGDKDKLLSNEYPNKMKEQKSLSSTAMVDNLGIAGRSRHRTNGIIRRCCLASPVLLYDTPVVLVSSLFMAATANVCDRDSVRIDLPFGCCFVVWFDVVVVGAIVGIMCC